MTAKLSIITVYYKLSNLIDQNIISKTPLPQHNIVLLDNPLQIRY